jgi:hypothetical protein
MRAFAGEWADESYYAAGVAAQLPWGHLMVLLDRIKNRTTPETEAASVTIDALAAPIKVNSNSRQTAMP